MPAIRPDSDVTRTSSVHPSALRFDSTSGAPQRLRLGLEWFLNPDHLPFLIAQEQGWLAADGIELELVEPQAHLDAFAAIAAGEMDLAITEPLHLVEDRAAGRSAVAFARFLHTNGGVMFLGGRGIERPRDMAGKRLQYPGAPGPGGPAIVNTMIEADGGTPTDLVKVNHGFQHTAALLAGEDEPHHADLATLAFYNFEVVEARHQGHDARFFALKDWGVPDFCQLVLVADEARLQQEPAVFEALLRSLRRGLDFIHQQPAQARKIYFERTGVPEDDALMGAIFDATVPCFTFDLDMSDAYYDRLAAWMRARGLVEVDVEGAGCFVHTMVSG